MEKKLSGKLLRGRVGRIKDNIRATVRASLFFLGGGGGRFSRGDGGGGGGSKQTTEKPRNCKGVC